MKRSCERHTQAFDLPVRRMTSLVIGAQQDNLTPPDVLMRRITIPRERGRAAAISGLKSDGNSRSHPPDSHVSSPPGIPNGFQMSGSIH
jgi:hypothetical protein